MCVENGLLSTPEPYYPVEQKTPISNAWICGLAIAGVLLSMAFWR